MTAGPILDPAAMDRLREWGGNALPRKLIAIFLDQAPERVGFIREGIATGVPQRAEAGAHSLKSSAGNVGAVQLQRQAERAETLAREGKLAELEGMLEEIETAFEAACAELEKVMEGLTE